MAFHLKRLEEVAKQTSEKERREVVLRDENRDWLLNVIR